MVFAGYHYKTFDGKIYGFRNIGKYQLVSDCFNHTFSVRITYTYQEKKHRLTFKRILIKYNSIRINLKQKYKVKVNGKAITFPYKTNGKIRIVREHENIIMNFALGIQILWNGKGFLEVTVPTSYKTKLCGLCGNFNGNVQDDLKMKNGFIANDSQIVKFGSSWCVGKNCSRNNISNKVCKPSKAIGKCKYLKSEELFKGCNSKLNYSKYYKACIHDMCNCPNGRCYCDSLTAYAQECKRLGIKLQNWKKNSFCHSNYKITKHSMYSNYFNVDIDSILQKRKMNTSIGKSPIPLH